MTAPEHSQLERALRINTASATEGDRVAFLCALYGWLRPTARGMWSDGWSDDVRPELRARKYDWLRRDLERSGVDCERLPCCGAEPPPARRGRWAQLGYAYVHEGSLRGGEVLRRRWRAAGSQVAEGRYLAGYGDDGAASWRAFVAEIERRCAHDDAGAERAGRYAVEAFRSLRSWCGSRGVTL